MSVVTVWLTVHYPETIRNTSMRHTDDMFLLTLIDTVAFRFFKNTHYLLVAENTYNKQYDAEKIQNNMFPPSNVNNHQNIFTCQHLSPYTSPVCSEIRWILGLQPQFLNKKWLIVHRLTVNFHTSSTGLLSPPSPLTAPWDSAESVLV